MLPAIHLARAIVDHGHRVRLYTCDWLPEGIHAAAKEAGAEVVLLGCTRDGGEPLTKEWLAEQEKTTIFAVAYHAPMLEALSEALGGRRPDVVVAGFGALAGMDVAHAMGLPLVITWPNPLSSLVSLCGILDSTTQRSFLGLHVGRSSGSMLAFAAWANMHHLGDWFGAVQRHIRRGAVVLVNSFWGLDAPRALPPNIVMTGPLLPPPSRLLTGFAAKHPELDAFLAGAGRGGAILVTTGSLVELLQWQVEAIYWGLKAVGCKVVWSLKAPQQALLPEASDPNFLISAWVPQAALLQHPAVGAVITHCGWGGTLEVLTAAKPVVAMPFFGDQPSNAQLLVEAGVGVPIGRVPRSAAGPRNPYRAGDVTPATVSAAVRRVLADGAFRAAAARLAAASRAMGGGAEAARHVEWAARLGTARLAPSSLARSVGSPLHRGLAVACAAVAVLVAGGLARRRGLR